MSEIVTRPPVHGCEGPLVWFDVAAGPGEEAAAVLECPCGYVVTTGNIMDQQHRYTPLLRSSQ